MGWRGGCREDGWVCVPALPLAVWETLGNDVTCLSSSLKTGEITALLRRLLVRLNVIMQTKLLTQYLALVKSSKNVSNAHNHHLI